MKAGWKTVKLGEIAEIYNGNTVSDEDKKRLIAFPNAGLAFIATKDVGFDGVINYDNGINIPGDEAGDFKVARKNAVLVCAEGGSAGRKIGHIDRDVHFGNKLFALNASSAVLPRYLYHYCLSEDFRKKFKGLMAGLIGGVSVAKFKQIEIPLPPLAEQKRIVALLDEAFAGIDAAKAKAAETAKEARNIFESHVQSIFAMKGTGWIEKTLKEVCEKITDGTHQTPKYFDSGVVFLSSRNVTSGKIDWDNIKYIDTKQHLEMHKRVAPRPGDILLAKNGTTGVAAIVDRETTFDIYVSLALLRALPSIRPRLLLFFINSASAKAQFNKRIKGVGVSNLHLEEIREVALSFPADLKAQDCIVLELDKINEETGSLHTIYRQKLEKLIELKASLLAQAFTGELTA